MQVFADAELASVDVMNEDLILQLTSLPCSDVLTAVGFRHFCATFTTLEQDDGSVGKVVLVAFVGVVLVACCVYLEVLYLVLQRLVLPESWHVFAGDDRPTCDREVLVHRSEVAVVFSPQEVVSFEAHPNEINRARMQERREVDFVKVLQERQPVVLSALVQE